jgi:hypothetical protein
MNKIFWRLMYVLTMVLCVVWVFTFFFPIWLFFGSRMARWPFDLLFDIELDKL